MARTNALHDEALLFSVPEARWVVGVLSMVIAVVGKDSLLGLIVRETRADINGLIRKKEPARGFNPENN